MQQTQDASPAIRSVLTIAGSDSGGGAGIQADLKTFAAFEVHGLSAIAALTAQNTQGVTAVHVPPVEFLDAQLDALFADFAIGAVKIGMLADAARIECVAAALERHADMPVVLDPVMVASSGARLLEDAAVDALRRLAGRATVLTPNVPEAEVLLGRRLETPEALRMAGSDLLQLGSDWVLLKGGHAGQTPSLIDRLFGRDGSYLEVRSPRLDLEGHGTGCTLAAAVAALLARGQSVPDACESAIRYVGRALAGGSLPGRARLTVLDHFGAAAAQPKAC